MAKEKEIAHAVSPDSANGDLQRFLSRGEAATLIGMLAAIFSLFLPWESHVIPANMILPLPAVYSHPLSITYHGISTVIRWPITICSVGCGLMLLWTPDHSNRRLIGAGQGLMGAVCFLIALARFSMLSGVLVGLAGGALMIYGAVDRYTAADQTKG